MSNKVASSLNREYGIAYGCTKCTSRAYWEDCKENHLPNNDEIVGLLKSIYEILVRL